MRYLGLALYAEGPTDHDFLCPLLLRLCEDLCGRSRHEVQLHEVLSLNGRGRPAAEVEDDLSRADRIFALAAGTRDEWSVLFVHSDGARKERTVREEQVNPALRLIEEDASLNGRKGCAVVPVYEMEAWALCDPVALCRATGKSESSTVDGVPDKPADVEGFDKPKQKLKAVLRGLERPRARRRKPSENRSVLSDLGKNVSLERLRDVPSFQKLENELLDVLGQLRVLG